MKNSDQWKPTKYVRHSSGKLLGARDPNVVGIGSRLIVDLLAQQFDKHIRNHCRGRLLDLGCGNVPLYGAYRLYIDDNVCVDWADTLHNNNFTDYEQDLSEPLPFPDDSFDTIILSDVLEHLPDPAIIWTEMGRILRPGGKILLSVPFYYWLHEVPHDYYRFTEFALRRFVQKSGLKTVLVESIGGAPEILTDIVAKNAVRLGGPGRIAAGLAQVLCRLFLQTRLGQRASKGSATSFPLGYFLIAENRPCVENSYGPCTPAVKNTGEPQNQR